MSKKVSGYIYVRALGQYEFEFFVPDNYTKEQINQAVEDKCNYFIDYNVEDGYEEVTRTVTEFVKVR